MSLRLPSGDDGLGWQLVLAIMAGIIALGTFWCYWNNSRGDNTDFLDRFIAVNFVVSMRFFVAYIGIMAALFLFSTQVGDAAFLSALSALGDNALLYLAIMIAVFGLYYYFVAKYIGHIAETTTPKKNVDKGA